MRIFRKKDAEGMRPEYNTLTELNSNLSRAKEEVSRIENQITAYKSRKMADDFYASYVPMNKKECREQGIDWKDYLAKENKYNVFRNPNNIPVIAKKYGFTCSIYLNDDVETGERYLVYQLRKVVERECGMLFINYIKLRYNEVAKFVEVPNHPLKQLNKMVVYDIASICYADNGGYKRTRVPKSLFVYDQELNVDCNAMLKRLFNGGVLNGLEDKCASCPFYL